MALSDWTSLIMSDGEKRWKDAGRKPTVDKRPEQRRNKVLAGIDNALRQLAGNEASPRRGWYSTKSDVCRATVRLGARPIPLNGAETHVYIAADRASDFYQGVRAHVESGGLDEAIAQLSEKREAAGRTRGRSAVRGGHGSARGIDKASSAESTGAATEAAPKSKRRKGNKSGRPAKSMQAGIAAQAEEAAAPKGRSRRASNAEPGARPKRGRPARAQSAAEDAVATGPGTKAPSSRRPRKKRPAGRTE